MSCGGFVPGPRVLPMQRVSLRLTKAPSRRALRVARCAVEVSSKDVSIDERIAATKSVKANGQERVRFAPSPTGTLHVGGARTALYNFLHAKNQGGKVILRVEDTDVARSTRESEDAVLRDLKWLGIEFDEGPQDIGGSVGPYRQSERSEIYVELAQRLLKSGHAYPCFCTEEELEMKRQIAEREGRPPQYDGTWRDADPEEVQRRIDAGEEYTVRFKIPENSVIAIDDIVRGKVEWDANATVGDFILLRSTGVPVYNFCVAVDDALMGITTVIRAEEHLTNSLRQILILNALGFEVPKYAHCSLILGSDRSKLSKRHGATSCDDYRKQGYLPAAMINYLALLGWNDGTTRELYYDRGELHDSFGLNRVSASPTMFDQDKLMWINGQHLRSMEVTDLAPLAYDHLIEVGLLDESVSSDSELMLFMTKLFQGSMSVVNDVATELTSALSYPIRETIESGETEGLLEEGSGFKELGEMLVAAFDAGELPDGSQEDHAALWKAWVKAAGKATKKKGKGLFHPIRLALTGKMSGPDVGQVLALLNMSEGKAKDLVALPARIEILREVLKTV